MVCFADGHVGQVSWRLSESAEQILVQKQMTERKTMQQEKDELIFGAFVLCGAQYLILTCIYNSK